MTEATAKRSSARLEKLAEQLDAQDGYAEVVASLTAGHSAALGGVWGSSCALVAANLTRHVSGAAGRKKRKVATQTDRGILVVVCPRDGDIDDFCDDIAIFAPHLTEAGRIEKFPAWET